MKKQKVALRLLGNQTSNNNNNSSRPDPMAKRPNKFCDPYGQQGKPLSKSEISLHLPTIDAAWTPTDDSTALHREFFHHDFIQAATFAKKIAAVAQLNAHFPSITIDRRIIKKQWQVVSRIRCHTFVLGNCSIEMAKTNPVSFAPPIGDLLTNELVILRTGSYMHRGSVVHKSVPIRKRQGEVFLGKRLPLGYHSLVPERLVVLDVVDEDQVTIDGLDERQDQVGLGTVFVQMG